MQASTRTERMKAERRKHYRALFRQRPQGLGDSEPGTRGRAAAALLGLRRAQPHV